MKYFHDCHKCTNKVTDGKDFWCRPIADGYNPMRIKGDCGKNFESYCDEYATEPKQLAFYESR